MFAGHSSCRRSGGNKIFHCAFALAMTGGAAREAATSDLLSPRAAARLPVSNFAPGMTGPGLGAELVHARNATLTGTTLTLSAATDGDSLAIVRWLGITP